MALPEDVTIDRARDALKPFLANGFTPDFRRIAKTIKVPAWRVEVEWQAMKGGTAPSAGHNLSTYAQGDDQGDEVDPAAQVDLLDRMRTIGDGLGEMVQTLMNTMRRKMRAGDVDQGRIVELLTALGITIDKLRALKKEDEAAIHHRILLADDEPALDMLIAHYQAQYRAMKTKPMVR